MLRKQILKNPNTVFEAASVLWSQTKHVVMRRRYDVILPGGGRHTMSYVMLGHRPASLDVAPYDVILSSCRHLRQTISDSPMGSITIRSMRSEILRLYSQ